MMRISVFALALLAAAGSMAPAASLVDPNNPTGSHGLVLIDKVGHHVRFFDPATFKEISNLDIGINPHDLAFSPDHKTVYIPVYGDGVYGRNPHPGHEVAIIDLGSRQVEAMVDVSPYVAPHGVQVDSHGMVYVTCDISRKLLVINPKTRKVEAGIDTDGTGHWSAVLPDGSKAYVALKNDRKFISVIDLKTRKLVKRIEAPNGTEGITASPDGKQVIAVDYTEPALLVIDTKKDEVVDRVPLEGLTRASFKPRYTPDGRKLLVCSMDGTVNILDTADLHGKQTVLKVGKNPMGFAIAPDGNTVLVANHGDGTVSVIDLREGRVVSSFRGGTGIETLAYY